MEEEAMATCCRMLGWLYNTDWWEQDEDYDSLSLELQQWATVVWDSDN